MQDIKHTIISWDCAYRNFFHLIDSLLNQNFPKNKFELIYVEQRTKKFANNFNHREGLKSLEDKYQEVKNKINIKIIYLNEDENQVYHLGKSNNAGLAIARGKFISVMDGDQLVPNDFLVKLTEFYRKRPNAVINIYRKNAQYPVGVRSYKDWKNGIISFEKCLNACKEKNVAVPKKINNFGPMVSCAKKYWEKIDGYDTHILWSTGLSKLAQDTTKRLEIATGCKSIYLPDCFTVHPWHPIGIGAIRTQKDIKKYFSFQDKLTKWSVQYGEPSYKKRKKYADIIYQKNKKIVDSIIYGDLNNKFKNVIPKDNIIKIKIATKLCQIFHLFC